MDDSVFYAVWLTLYDVEFVQQYGSRLTPEMFPRGPLQALLVLGKEQALEYRRPTTENVMRFVIDEGWPFDRYSTTVEEVQAVYADLDHFAVGDDVRTRAVEAVLDWARQRQMGMALDAGLKALGAGDVDEASAALTAARAPYAPDERPLRLTKDFRQILGSLPDNAIPTGFGKIDRQWSGGIRPGEFGIGLAATNVGKTQLLCFLSAIAFKADKQVLFYTFELSPKQILRRITSAVLRRAITRVAEEEAPELLARVQTLHHLNGADIEIRAGTKSVADVLLDLDELDREHRKPDILIFDSADDLTAVRTYQSEYQRLGEIYTDMRSLALEAKIAIWTSTQANREAIDKARISLKHIGDSFWKAKRGHYVFGFSQTNQQREEAFGPFMTLSILKDSEHGTPGQYFTLRPTFGRGSEGFPGFEEIDENEA